MRAPPDTPYMFALKCAMAAANGPLAGRGTASLRLADGRLVANDSASEPLADAVGRLTAGALEAHAEQIPQGPEPESMQKL